jgi:flagellar P-ring protein precursor FlgI
MRRTLALLFAVVALAAAPLAAQVRVGDLARPAGSVPRRLVGYGLVTGLDGTGDRSFGTLNGETPTVRSIVNLLKRFNVVVPPEAMRPRNVAAVVVTAEVSPWLRAGGRFDVQIASLGDATSLHGGVLWITPLVSDPNQPPMATAQGALVVEAEESRVSWYRRGNSGRIPDGGVLEVDGPVGTAVPRLALREPDLGTATRIADAISAAYGQGSAKVEDPGSIALTPPAQSADNLLGFLAALDTLPVTVPSPSRVVINARDGTVVAGGDLRVGAAAVSRQGITLRIGGADSSVAAGSLRMDPGASVQDVAAGLHAAGATSKELAAIFDALVDVGALRADVVVR